MNLPRIYATRKALDEYGRLGGAGVLETAIEAAICAGRERKRTGGETKTIWLLGGPLEVVMARIESPLTGRRAWRAEHVRRRR